jgi:hypothetical protein
VFPWSNRSTRLSYQAECPCQAFSEERLEGTRNGRFTVDLSTLLPRLYPRIHAKGL